MDFANSDKGKDYLERLQAFMDERVYPAEKDYEEYRRERGYNDHTCPAGGRGAEERGPLARALEPLPAGRLRPDQPRVRPARRADRALDPHRARRRSTAPPRTPATWKCSTCSVRRSRRRSGCSR